ncbi:MAG: biopolymer transporter ExbD [Nitrospirota bacterium]|nr:biopolymer transporter ExbD [Nitrospirota bacterium]
MKIMKVHKKKPRIEIIPMIDVMFFLLVFFMVASLSMVAQKGIGVNLPEAGTTAAVNKNERVVVSVTADNRVFYNKEACTVEMVRTRIAKEVKDNPQVMVVLQADKDVKHGRVVEVMDAIKAAGATKMAVATDAKLVAKPAEGLDKHEGHDRH